MAFEVAQSMKELEALGWFAHYPDAAKAIIQQTLEKSASGDKPLPFPGIVKYDDEGIAEEGAYAALVKVFAAQSVGLLQPADVKEHWETAGEWTIVRFSFHNNGQTYAGDFGYDGPWVEDRFYALMNKALEDQGTDLRWYVLGEGEAGLAPVSLYADAVEKGLAPEAADPAADLGEDAVIGGALGEIPSDDDVAFSEDDDDTVGTF